MKLLKTVSAYNLDNRVLGNKWLISLIVLAFVSFTAQAQKGSAFGIKGGLNYNANGDYFESVGENSKSPDRNIGYHVGLFGKFGNKFFFRPELVYTSTKSDYENNVFDMKKMDAPLLFGFKVIGPATVFAGPSLQYILDTEFAGIDINDVENEFSVGLNFGIGVNLNRIGIDLRYERGFNNNEANFINSNFGPNAVSRIDTRPDQLILSLSVAL